MKEGIMDLFFQINIVCSKTICDVSALNSQCQSYNRVHKEDDVRRYVGRDEAGQVPVQGEDHHLGQDQDPAVRQVSPAR